MFQTAINISSIIKNKLFFHEFQPLWGTETKEIFAYEALIRTEQRVNPFLIFQYGREHGNLYEYDVASISNAVKDYPDSFYNKYYLFINIFPSTLVHSSFPDYIKGLLRAFPLIKGKVVFEINEEPLESEVWEEDIFKERLDILKKLDFLVALDDLTLTINSVKKITEYNPDFVKLDRSCSKNLSHSLSKQKAIHSLMKTSKESIVVLEGIERKDDFSAASRIGIPALQGYYIAKPHRL